MPRWLPEADTVGTPAPGSMRLSRSFTFLALILFAAGCGSVMNRIGTMAAGMMTGSTDDLSAINYQIVYTDQAVPTESGEASVNAISDWQSRQPLVSSVLFKRSGIGLLNLDGDVMLDGAPLPRTFPGSYSTFFDTPASGPLSLEFVTAQGQSDAFSVRPRPPVRITRINGEEPDGATVDLTQPLVLELDRSASDAAELRIALLGTTMGVKGFWDVAVVAAADRIELPADIWTHTQGNPINRGETWLKVEEYVRPEPQRTSTGGQAMVVAYASDYAQVTVTGERADNLVGIARREAATLEGTVESGGREIEWTAIKPVAFQSPPLNRARRLALVTLKAEARSLSQTSTSTSTASGGPGVTVTTTTTRTRQFAQLGDAFWESLLVDLYSGIERELGNYMRADIIPVGDVVAAQAYQRFPSVDDASTASYARHSYGGLRDLDAMSFTSLFVDASGPFGAARLDNLIRELGVDGLIVVELDLVMPGDEFSLSPTLTVHVLAPQSDPMQPAGLPSYVDLTITGQGREVTNDMLENPAQLRQFLPTAVNLSGLIEAFGEGLGAVAAFEGGSTVYDVVWDGR